MEFDHVGFVSSKKRERENWVENTRVWVTNPKEHPYHIEWLRFEPDSECPRPLQDYPHVAYRVDDLDKAAEGLEVILEPMIVDGFVKAGFYRYKDGTIVEFMEYLHDAGEWFPGQNQ